MRYIRVNDCIIFLILLTSTTIIYSKEKGEKIPTTDCIPNDSSYWQIQTTGSVGNTICALSAVDNNVCWLAGKKGIIILTTDGGNIWSPINSGIIATQDINVIEGVNNKTAFASTKTSDTTFIYRTDDAGSSWVKAFSQYNGKIFGIKMYDTINGIAVGDAVDSLWTVLKTTDGGACWYRIPTEPPIINYDSNGANFGTFDTSCVWFYNRGGNHFMSWDDGLTWAYDTLPLSLGPHIMCVNQSDYWLTIWNFGGYLYHYGTYVAAAKLPYFRDPVTGLVGVHGAENFWLVQHIIFYSPYGGMTWSSDPPNGLDKPATFIDIVTLDGQVSGWAIGVGDTVYRYNRILTDFHEQVNIPLGFSLNQNYPNPFNPNTTIKYQIPVRCNATLKIFDVLGREVAALVNRIEEAGEKSIVFDANNLPSGVYFYKLQAGSFTQVKKMLLMK